MSTPPESTRLSLEQRLGDHASTAGLQLRRHVRPRGAFAYVEAELADGKEVKLMRLYYGGTISKWSFAPPTPEMTATKTPSCPTAPLPAAPQTPMPEDSP
ncbi:hypothetical protein ABT065_37795 [Streptomyces sp. NPDC002764]|uniref:hypothetical protein n=1 Tax=Streptomyces sp. NPDC002764 TaxID=3154428 RepID=UPI00331EAB7F